MSTRYVWGKYNRETKTGIETVYEEYTEKIGRFQFNMRDGQSYSIGSGYYLSKYSGSYSTTGNSYYTFKNQSLIVRGAGYITATSGAMYYGSRWQEYTANNLVNASNTIKYTTTTTQEQYTYYVRGSLLGYLSSSNRNQYPNNDYSGTTWYYYQGQDSIDAASVILPDNIEGGQTCNVTINPSTNKQYSGTVTYSIYYRYDEGSWNYLTATTSTNTMISVPKGTNSIQVRVQAKDDLGFTSSDYTTSKIKEVTNGSPPYIQWSYYVDQETEDYILHDVGDITEPFNFKFTPTDPDNDSMILYEGLFTLNEETMTGEDTLAYKETFDITSGLQRTSSILTDENVYLITPMDKKCGVILKLKDAYNMSSKNYIVAFNKANDEVTITLKNPMRVQGDITKGSVYLFGYFPVDSIVTVKVTNGANDDEVIWKDITEEALTGKAFEFDSTAQNGSAFNFEVYAKRGVSKETGYIDTIIGAFE